MPVKEVSLPLNELPAVAPVAGLSTPPESIPLVEPTLSVANGTATRIDLDYIVGSQQHCFWAALGTTGSYPAWLDADQVKTIVPVAFEAPTVYIQADSTPGSLHILRIRPIRTF